MLRADLDVDLIASVETTANTLAATLALLGFDQATQETVYQSIKKVLGDREPVRLMSK